MSTERAPAALVLDALRLGYGGTPLLPAIDLTVDAGEIWALVGRNGSGKSTLLHTLVGALPPVSGAVRWAEDTRLAWVPQRGAVDQSVPVRSLDVVASGLDRKWSFLVPWLSRAQRTAVDRALEETDAAALARQPYVELSEGQKQRILIARALVSEPTTLVLDEPSSAMDPINEQAIFDCIEAIRAQRGVTVLIASHHAEIVPFNADRVLFLDRHDQVVLHGSVDEILAAPAFKQRYTRRSAR